MTDYMLEDNLGREIHQPGSRRLGFYGCFKRGPLSVLLQSHWKRKDTKISFLKTHVRRRHCRLITTVLMHTPLFGNPDHGIRPPKVCYSSGTVPTLTKSHTYLLNSKGILYLVLWLSFS